jgi:hypothetical protein
VKHMPDDDQQLASNTCTCSAMQVLLQRLSSGPDGVPTVAALFSSERDTVRHALVILPVACVIPLSWALVPSPA